MPSRGRGSILGRGVAAALALLLLAGCGSSGATSAAGELTASRVDPPFEVSADALVTTEGEPYSLADTGNRLTLVFFGYTHCPDICPAVMSTVASALTRLDEADRAEVGLTFVTTDPARDTPEVLRRYLDGYDPSSVGVTGELQQVVDLARSLGVFVADAEALASGGYDFGSHGAQVIAVDGDGDAPAFWSQDTSSAEYAADLELLLRG